MRARNSAAALFAIAAAILVMGTTSTVNFGLEGREGNQDYSTNSDNLGIGSDRLSGSGTAERLNVKGYVTVSVVRGESEIYHYADHNLITDAGRDFISAQLGSTAPSSAGANYIGLSTDSTAPSASDTSLAGELTGNGLDRAQGAYSHTVGTNSFTIVEAFTATGTVSGVQKAGLFTAASGGTMLAENTFSSVNLISGDQLTITWTITIG